MQERIAAHYTQNTLGAAISEALESVIGGSRAVTIDDLAPVDEFHIGGRAASHHLFEQLDLSSDDRVLDVGSGIGGTARYVAQTYGCVVDGIDLTPEFCEVARDLTDLVGLGDRATFHEGSALAMPFEDGAFAVAYMMHVGMNINDKPALYSEIRRVLRPGGVLAIYDVLEGPNNGAFRFPVPWATESDGSFLAAPDEMQTYLREAGFNVEQGTDRSEFAINFFESVALPPGGSPPPISIQLIMGENARAKTGNMLENLKNGLCGPWEIIARTGDQS